MLLETLLAHRYLYYVLNTPVISDITYDVMEIQAIERTAGLLEKLNKPGSSLESDYPENIKKLAQEILEKH